MPDQVRLSLRNRRIEAAALGLLATMPLAPWIAYVLRGGVPAVVVTDAPALGLGRPYVVAALVNAVSAAGAVGTARLFARRSHGVSALLVVLGWLAAFGAGAVSPSSALLAALPLFALFVALAVLVRGKWAAAPVALGFAVLAFVVARRGLRPLEPRPAALALRDWAGATAWIPGRLGGGPWLAPLDLGAKATRLLAALHAAAMALAAVVARDRRDASSLAFLAVGAVAAALAVGALLRWPHGAFWAVAASSLAWVGILASLGDAFGAVLWRMPKLGRAVALPLVLLGFAAAIGVTVLEREVAARCP